MKVKEEAEIAEKKIQEAKKAAEQAAKKVEQDKKAEILAAMNQQSKLNDIKSLMSKN